MSAHYTHSYSSGHSKSDIILKPSSASLSSRVYIYNVCAMSFPRSSIGTSSSSRNRVDLPPIRTVLGDQLALPRPPSAYSPHTASNRSSAYVQQWEAHDRDGVYSRESGLYTESRENPFRHPNRSRAATVSSPSHPPSTQAEAFLPPSLSFNHSAQSLPPTPLPSIHSSSRAHSDPQNPPSPDAHTIGPPPWAQSILPNSAPPFSPQLPYYFGVLRTSPATGELITSPPITRLPNRTRTASSGSRIARVEDAVIARRHVCPVCQKRFPRPSSLITHQSVHNGSRPFPCHYPECDKKFSVASNMRRHYRKCHSKPGEDAAASPSPAASEGDGEMESEEEPASSSQHATSARSPLLRYSAIEDYPMDDDN